MKFVQIVAAADDECIALDDAGRPWRLSGYPGQSWKPLPVHPEAEKAPDEQSPVVLGLLKALARLAVPTTPAEKMVVTAAVALVASAEGRLGACTVIREDGSSVSVGGKARGDNS